MLLMHTTDERESMKEHILFRLTTVASIRRLALLHFALNGWFVVPGVGNRNRVLRHDFSSLR